MSVLDRARARWRMAPDRPLVGTSTATAASRAAVLRRLELDVTRRLDGLLSGDHLSATSGPGSERAAARPYAPGDDARRIDWSLTARMHQAHVRTTEADRELETWIVADRSASLDFGTARHEKRDVVLGAVAGFGFLGARGGNRIGVVTAGGQRLVSRRARAGRNALLAALATVHDSPRDDGAPAAGAGLSDALSFVERTHTRRGRVVVVSDFLGPDGWAGPLGRLSRRHEVVAVHVTDPRELSLPSVGMLTLIDTESGRRLDVQSDAEELRRRYAGAAAARHDEIARVIAATGAAHLHLSTDRDWVVDLATFIAGARGTASRRPRGSALR